MRARRALALVLAPALLGGCGAIEWQREHPLSCRPDERSLVRDALYLGASMPGGGEVDANAWRQFENDTLAEAFPQGYTVTAADGAWRGDDGGVIHEPSRILIVVHADTAAWAATLRRVAAAYRDRFRQQSVLHEHSVVCARF